MKQLIILFTILISVHSVRAQEFTPKNNIEGFFTAVIVTDIEATIKWYKNNLRFETLDFNKYESRGFAQANLKLQNFHLELIQLNSAIDLSHEIDGYSKKTKIVGIFKVGIKVNNFDELLSTFERNNVGSNAEVVNDPVSNKRMIIVLDPDGNRIQVFEN